MKSVTSSTRPGTLSSSWATPAMRTAVTAAPSMEESKMRRSAFPTVTPQPRSKGWAEKTP